MKSERNLLRINRTIQIFVFAIVHTPFCSRIKAQPEKKSPGFVAWERDTVSLWINAWQECGCKGLEDNKRSGRPPILTVEEQAKAIEIALRNPRVSAPPIERNKPRDGQRNQPVDAQRLAKKKTSFGRESSWGCGRKRMKMRKSWLGRTWRNWQKKLTKGW